ncbi:hypothetical protein [Billgrantia saliphila]|nr:hypothetical protein [Halomonas saliphila]
MTSTSNRHANAWHRATSAAFSRGAGFGGQYWYWFTSGVPAAGS